MRYKLVPRKFWRRKEGFSNCPKTVSIHGSLPRPIEAYEMVEQGFSIFDSKENTYSNYFFGKVGIDSKEEGEKIIARLMEKFA